MNFSSSSSSSSSNEETNKVLDRYVNYNKKREHINSNYYARINNRVNNTPVVNNKKITEREEPNTCQNEIYVENNEMGKKTFTISPHGDAILKKLKIRLNACIILLLLVYLIGTIFFVNIKF
jgi:hypothetical protein